MKLVIPEPNITVGVDGFEKGLDLLSRSDFGRQFTELVDKIDGPMVLALDGGWGSGKSMFLKMWAGAHANQFGGQAKIIYFDAFKHDFLDEPLVSLVGSIPTKGDTKTFYKKAVTGLRSAAAKLTKPAIRVGLAAATGGISEITGPVIDATLGKSADILEAEISDFWKDADGKREAMEQFRNALIDLTKTDDKNALQRIVFIVDELDRCRPDYALTVLEIIKHFFSVPNVHFVLGVNLVSLQNSVKARYGTDIDAEEYLKKFIHLTTRLPSSERQNVDFPQAVEYFRDIAEMHSLPTKTAESIILHLRELVKMRTISLRDVERIYTKAALLSGEFNQLDWGYIDVNTTALLFNILAPTAYAKVLNGTITVNDIGRFYGYNKSGVFEKPHDNHENYRRRVTFFLWSRMLNFPPDQETIEFTKGAFGRFGNEIYETTLKNQVHKYLETWEISTLKEK